MVKFLPETLGRQSWPSTAVAARCSSRRCRGLLVGLESRVPAIYSKTTPPLLEKYWFGRGNEVTFFTLHIVADQEHGDRGHEIVEKYATHAGAVEGLRRPVREAVTMRRLYLDGLHPQVSGGRGRSSRRG